MESTNLNSPDGEDDLLRRLLLNNTAPLPDDGFSARVLCALKPNKPRAPHLGLWLSLVGAAGGLALAVEKIGSWSTLSADVGQIGNALAPVLLVLTDPGLIVAITAVATSLLVTFVVSRAHAPLR
ncbi:MAG: hypothetical protein ABIZ04_00965 [Opitutus sp.]